MKDNQAKYPQLRFKCFTDPWEQRKLTDISEKVTEKNSDNEFSETLTNSAEYGIISQRDFFDKDISNEKNLNTYYVVRDGDFVYNPRISNFAPVGPIKRNTLGRTGVMSPLYYIFRAHNVDGMYLEKYFSSTKWHRFMELNGDTGARADRFAIKDKDFVQMPIPLPNLEEQSKIARFLENVDNLIAANQRKLDLLKEQKKGYLQKMFPKNGTKVPELRFAGFADAWEQRKLSDIATLNARIGWQNLRASEFLESGDYMLITGTNFHDGTVDYSTVHYVEKNRYEQDTKIQVENGSILITKDGTLGKVALVQGLNMPATLNAGVFNVKIKDPGTIDVDYVYQYLAAPFLMKYANAKSTGGTIKHLNQNILIDFPVPLPRKREQVKLAELLNGLDNTITLQQRKLEKLQKLKKGYLQKMFC
ncbi:type I restriction-modification system, specificity subunit S [Pediococcus damnosus LMG 28219]|uniref:restriction endonuclease subunit S n=1 Tax=Pediococcus damnosus TaxID=51663 RepID=UPI00061F9D23|nr:restriction endonuclease subunit S [Pediococcus damnosus]KJU73703.1 type I restriction-modification system, specificity subunit S [Pediococcus damnosus LMG 28219]